MAKKKSTSSRKTAASKTHAARSRSASSKKKTTKKKASASASRKTATSKKKTTTKKASSTKKTTRKPTTKKSGSKKSGSKKSTTKKTTARKSPSKKKTSSNKKTTRKKTPSKKPTAKKADGKSSSSKSASKTSPSKKRSTQAAAGQDGSMEQKSPKVPVPKPSRIKSPLDRKQLQHFRDLLLEKRLELIGDLAGLENSALRGQDTSNLSNMPLHMADAGSDTYDQDLALGLLESERQMLNEIDDALERIAKGTYGICEATGQPINKARLEAKPWAKYSIEAARQMEKQNHQGGYGGGWQNNGGRW